LIHFSVTFWPFHSDQNIRWVAFISSCVDVAQLLLKLGSSYFSKQSLLIGHNTAKRLSALASFSNLTLSKPSRSLPHSVVFCSLEIYLHIITYFDFLKVHYSLHIE